MLIAGVLHMNPDEHKDHGGRPMLNSGRDVPAEFKEFVELSFLRRCFLLFLSYLRTQNLEKQH